MFDEDSYNFYVGMKVYKVLECKARTFLSEQIFSFQLIRCLNSLAAQVKLIQELRRETELETDKTKEAREEVEDNWTSRWCLCEVT